MSHCCDRRNWDFGVGASVDCAYYNSLVNGYQHGSGYGFLA